MVMHFVQHLINFLISAIPAFSFALAVCSLILTENNKRVALIETNKTAQNLAKFKADADKQLEGYKAELNQRLFNGLEEYKAHLNSQLEMHKAKVKFIEDLLDKKYPECESTLTVLHENFRNARLLIEDIKSGGVENSADVVKPVRKMLNDAYGKASVYLDVFDGVISFSGEVYKTQYRNFSEFAHLHKRALIEALDSNNFDSISLSEIKNVESNFQNTVPNLLDRYRKILLEKFDAETAEI